MWRSRVICYTDLLLQVTTGKAMTGKPFSKLYFGNFIKLMTWYYILKFTCSFSEAFSCALQWHMKNASSAVAALSQRNEWFPMSDLHCIDSVSNARSPQWAPEHLFKWTVGIRVKKNRMLIRSCQGVTLCGRYTCCLHWLLWSLGQRWVKWCHWKSTRPGNRTPP